MKPAPFEYHSPATVPEALELLGELEDAKVLAGGQSLVPLLNFRLARPAHVVDINRIPGLDGIQERDGGVAIGALVRQSTAERSPLLRRLSPLVPLALRQVAHVVIRNRGTVAGSLAHADPAAELGAVVLALGGRLHAASRGGEREIPSEDFFKGPLESALENDELLTEVWVPNFDGPVALLEECRRHGDFALAGVALAGDRMAAFGIATTPVLVDPTSPGLGLTPSGDLEATPDFKLHLLGVLARRAIAERRRPDFSKELAPAPPAAGNVNEGFEVNGKPRSAPRTSRRLLSDYLRHELGLTGTHVGCEHGVCGCCTILFDGRPVRSCLMLAVQAKGHRLTTVEGLAENGSLHPIQRAFHEAGGLQCGFCTPGFLMATAGLLAENPRPNAAAIEEAISGNLCRCTGYAAIRRAVGIAAGLAGADA
jgi:xanthine dehydrogenase iron-sulfur cluster and FAD-binding subunit A